LATDWQETEPFCQNKIIGYSNKVAEDIDLWLETLGYEREGLYYRVGERPFDTVAMFSHGGSSSAALTHIFNLPLPFFCSAIRPGFTAVTVVKFSDEEGKLVAPEFEILNDARHIMHIDAELVFDN
jgi:probable phosphoglycerate mutase